MSAGGEYEPKDSRQVVGTTGTPDKSWREQQSSGDTEGEYAPLDQRNVTGQPSQTDDRWKNEQRRPPRADGLPPESDESAP